MEHIYIYINLLPKSSRPTVDSIHVNRSQTESDCLFLLKKNNICHRYGPKAPPVGIAEADTLPAAQLKICRLYQLVFIHQLQNEFKETQFNILLPDLDNKISPIYPSLQLWNHALKADDSEIAACNPSKRGPPASTKTTPVKGLAVDKKLRQANVHGRRGYKLR